MCGVAPGGGGSSEGVASCSLCCSGHTGTPGVFLGSRSSCTPESKALVPPDDTPFPLYSLCQSLKNNNVPGIPALIAAAGVQKQALASTSASLGGQRGPRYEMESLQHNAIPPYLLPDANITDLLSLNSSFLLSAAKTHFIL